MPTNIIEKKEMVKIIDKNDPEHAKSAEDREYLICLYMNRRKNERWDIVTGRTEAYELIKDEVQNNDVDFNNSFVLVESLKLNQRKSIYAFMKYCESFFDDGFNIDDYIYDDLDIDISNLNGIDDNINISNNDRLNMSSLMDGDFKTTSLE